MADLVTLHGEGGNNVIINLDKVCTIEDIGAENRTGIMVRYDNGDLRSHFIKEEFDNIGNCRTGDEK